MHSLDTFKNISNSQKKPKKKQGVYMTPNTLLKKKGDKTVGWGLKK